jgi:hypothetical protein
MNFSAILFRKAILADYDLFFVNDLPISGMWRPHALHEGQQIVEGISKLDIMRIFIQG